MSRLSANTLQVWLRSAPYRSRASKCHQMDSGPSQPRVTTSPLESAIATCFSFLQPNDPSQRSLSHLLLTPALPYIFVPVPTFTIANSQRLFTICAASHSRIVLR